MNGNAYRQIGDLQDKIDALEQQKQTLLNNGNGVVPGPASRSSAAGGVTAGKRVMSPEAKAKIAAAARARWAKIKGMRPKTSAAGNTGGKRQMSAAGRKRIAKAQKARWAAIHAQQAAAAPAA